MVEIKINVPLFDAVKDVPMTINPTQPINTPILIKFSKNPLIKSLL